MWMLLEIRHGCEAEAEVKISGAVLRLDNPEEALHLEWDSAQWEWRDGHTCLLAKGVYTDVMEGDQLVRHIQGRITSIDLSWPMDKDGEDVKAVAAKAVFSGEKEKAVWASKNRIGTEPSTFQVESEEGLFYLCPDCAKPYKTDLAANFCSAMHTR